MASKVQYTESKKKTKQNEKELPSRKKKDANNNNNNKRERCLQSRGLPAAMSNPRYSCHPLSAYAADAALSHSLALSVSATQHAAQESE